MQAPHLSVTVHARGMLNHAQTRLYFEDEPANADDPILALVPAERRATLIARREEANGTVTLPPGHHPPGQGRDRLLQHLTTCSLHPPSPSPSGRGSG